MTYRSYRKMKLISSILVHARHIPRSPKLKSSLGDNVMLLVQKKKEKRQPQKDPVEEFTQRAFEKPKCPSHIQRK